MENKIEIIKPSNLQITQRDANDQAKVLIDGRYKGDEITVTSDGGGVYTITVDETGRFGGNIPLTSGWHNLTLTGNSDPTDRLGIDKLGVGEIFLTAGQSNSANHGFPCQQTVSGNVTSLGLEGWQIADDPQPVATGEGGTPWPLLGDLLNRKLMVPIGLASVGVGGTAVWQWDPSAENSLYLRLQQALQQLRSSQSISSPADTACARAVLWHQGESDTVAGTSATAYADGMEQIIRQSWVDAGRQIPWFIAEVSYIGPDHTQQQRAVIEGQQELVSRGVAFAGPTTDDLIGERYRYDGVHFGQAGLESHAERWADCLSSYFGWD